MTGFRFAYPYAFALLALLPLLWLYWARRRRPRVRYSSLLLLHEAGVGSGPRYRRLVLPVFRSLAIVALIVAVARPQHADRPRRIFAEGVAIQMVVDTSSSMEGLDLSPPGRRMNRLEVVKEVFKRFVQGDDRLPGRPNDLIGMIRFARYADSVCPLTLDHKNLIQVIDATQMVVSQSPEDGTAIGDGLALAVERLKDLKRTAGSGEQITIKSKVIILLTDGENNAGMLAPEQAGELAALSGIKVYTIMAGTGRQVGFARAPVDDRPLRHIAEVTGGKHFVARDATALQRIYAEIDALERTRVEERSYEVLSELSMPLLLAAFALLGAQSLLDSTLLRKTP